MKRYSVARARQRLAEVLDRAESGESVVIERRGVEFELRARRRAAKARRDSSIEWLDPALESGSWSWSWSPRGLEFRGRKK